MPDAGTIIFQATYFNRAPACTRSMSAVAGEDIRVDVQIKEAAPLTNPLELTNEKLTGSEFIDLRE